jgi:hypothetical protein
MLPMLDSELTRRGEPCTSQICPSSIRAARTHRCVVVAASEGVVRLMPRWLRDGAKAVESIGPALPQDELA